MKNLIFINGTMGAGKSETGRALQKLLPKCVFLDGDWCWDMSPFIVNGETKAMVMANIAHLLNNFLSCSEFENIIFCWVMHEQSIMDDILSGLANDDYVLYKFSLVCSKEALRERLEKDIARGIRTEDVLLRSMPRLKNYERMDTQKIDVSGINALQAAEIIFRKVSPVK